MLWATRPDMARHQLGWFTAQEKRQGAASLAQTAWYMFMIIISAALLSVFFIKCIRILSNICSFLFKTQHTASVLDLAGGFVHWWRYLSSLSSLGCTVSAVCTHTSPLDHPRLQSQWPEQQLSLHGWIQWAWSTECNLPPYHNQSFTVIAVPGVIWDMEFR